MDSDQIRLWTIQRADAWEVAKARGVLRADGRRVWNEFRQAYAWMREQMRMRIPDCTGRYPVWTWAQPKPDLRQSGHMPTGVPSVRIEFLTPASRVLLSDFDAWHCVLNWNYLPLSREEDDEWDASVPWERRRGCADKLTKAELAEMHSSWERIFDLEAILNAPIWCNGRRDRQFVQATIEDVPLSQVVSVRPFVAR